MKDYSKFGWTKGATYGPQHPADWHRENIYIHDNGWGTIQVGVCKDELSHGAMTCFAFVEYFSAHRQRANAEYKSCKFTPEAAFEAAIHMCNGMIASGFNFQQVFDNRPDVK